MDSKAQHADATIKPNMTEEAKVDLLKTAIKHNPPGVRVVARNFKAHWAQLAHYTGFLDTNELKQFLNSSLVGPGVMVVFLNSHNNNFGSVTLLRPRQDRIFQFAYSPDAPAMLDSPIPFPIDPNEPAPTKAERMDRAVWLTVIAMHKIMMQYPTHFFAEPVNTERRCPGLPQEQRGRDILRNGHSPEDWSRAYWLLRALVCYSSRSKASASGSSRMRSDPIREPLYLTLKQERTRKLVADDLAVEASQGVESMERFDSIPGADSLITIPESRDVGHQAYHERIANDMLMAEVQGGSEDTKPLRTDMEDLRAKYMVFKATLSAVTATTRSYIHACDQLGLDPDRPNFPFESNSFVEPGIMRELKAWQVRFIDWSRVVEESRLHSWLLADESQENDDQASRLELLSTDNNGAVAATAAAPASVPITATQSENVSSVLTTVERVPLLKGLESRTCQPILVRKLIATLIVCRQQQS